MVYHVRFCRLQKPSIVFFNCYIHFDFHVSYMYIFKEITIYMVNFGPV